MKLHWYKLIIKARIKSFGLSFLFVLITGLLMRPSSSCLITPYTSLGIVDLELAFNQVWAEKILKHWEATTCTNALSLASNGRGAATINIILDFPFLIAYTWFFIVLVMLTATKKDRLTQFTSLLIYVCFLTGILDVIENVSMLLFIFDLPLSSYLFAVPATIKFSLILLLIGIVLIRIPFSVFSKE